MSPKLGPAPQILPTHGSKGRKGRRNSQALCPSRLMRSKLMAGDFWSRVPEEGSQLWERRRRPIPGVAVCNAKCHMSHCSVTVPEKPSPRERGWEAVFADARTVPRRVTFVLLRGRGERIPAGRGEGEQGRRWIPSADKEFPTSSIGICMFRHVGKV